MTLDLPRPRTAAPPRPAQRRVRARGLGELAAVVALYAFYSGARVLLPADTGAAAGHAASLLRLERLAHVDVEHALNTWVAAHAAVALLASYWYAALHYTVTPALLLTLRRLASGPVYRRLRNGLMAATSLALVGYATFPAAPPRLLDDGYTDVLAQMANHGWWGAEASAPRGMGGFTNQLAAMPSMHVGWAVWCALAAAALLRTTRARALAWLYPLGTLLVVMGTGNHYLVDGLAGAALVVACTVRRGATTTTDPRGLTLSAPQPRP